LRALLITWVIVLVAAVPLAWLAGGETRLTVVSRNGEVYAAVQGVRLDLPDASTYPAGALALPGRERLRVLTGDVSLYRQECGWPALGVTCAPGDLAQAVRPRSEWTGYLDNGDGSVSLSMQGGRSPGLVPLGGPLAAGPALVVRPERASVSWWRVENSEPVEQLDSASYRASGVTSARDLMSELLLVAWAASLLGLVAWGAARLARAIGKRTMPDEEEQPLQESEGRRPRFVLSRHAVPLGLFVAGTLVGAAACLVILQGIPHVQDEVAYIFQARIFALGRSWVPQPQAPEFFANAFVQFFDGRWFSKYPPGYPLLLAPALWAGVPWLVNALSAGIALAAVYMAGVAMYGQHVARWAALVGLLSPWVIFMSGSYMSHATTMMWAALFLLGLVQARRAAERQMLGRAARWGLFGGFAIGMAFITREWTALGIGLGGALWALIDLVLARNGRSPRIAAYLCFPLGFVPPLLFLLYQNHELTGDWLRLAQDLVGSYDRPGFGPGHGDATGHTPAQGLYNGVVYLRTLATMFDGWPAPFALAPILLGAFAWVGERGLRRLGWDALLWLSGGGLVLAYFAWWSSTTIYGPRYWYVAMPFLLLMAGRGLDLLGRVAARVTGPAWRGRAGWLVPGALFALFSLYTLTQGIPWQANVHRGYNDITPDALVRAESAGLSNALVFVALEPSRPNRDYGKVFFANDPLLRGPVVYARDLGGEANARLAMLYPDRRAYWLPLDGPPVPGVGPPRSP
jgi:4-amino-4-deoxy-L-arabinose transferase-like glycosyltransferase